MKSERSDGRGHWTHGKRRSVLTAEERRAFLAAIRRHAAAEGIRATARHLKCSDRSVRRWLAGEDWPTQMAIVRRARLL